MRESLERDGWTLFGVESACDAGTEVVVGWHACGCLAVCQKLPLVCNCVRGGKPKRPALHLIPLKRPFQLVGVDVMDLPKTLDGNCHVLVFQDYLTKWPLVYPIPD